MRDIIRKPSNQFLGTGTTYLHRGQLTPKSQPSQSRHVSPVKMDREKGFSENTLGAPKLATLPTNRPGGYGGFGDPKSNAQDKQRTGATFMERINNTIPGPFDPARRPVAATDAYSQRKEFQNRWTPPDERSPPRLPMKDGYEGFGAPNRLQNSHQPSLVRSETFPNPSSSTKSSRIRQSPSVSEPRAHGSHDPSGLEHDSRRFMGRDPSPIPPPRTGLLFEYTSKNAGSVDLAAEFGIKNPYHASMSSVSSGYSDSSVTNHLTAQTSLTVADTRSTGDRTKASDTRSDASAASSRHFAPQVAEMPVGTLPRDFQNDGVSHSPDSRQHTYAPYRREYMHSSSRTQGAGGGEGDGSGHAHEGRRFNTSNENMDLPCPKRQDTWEPQCTRGHISRPSRGDCKGCGMEITGKSISSADGRLTGKYHKACFVCSTCREPFPSSDFYVLGDKPYCAQDYHRLNNSLCGSCGRGIEGRFAEDEARVKYHVGCFRCLDCGLSLADGYFEVGGYAYCERDAWKRVQAQSYPEQGTYQPGPPHGTYGARTMNPHGFPGRPYPHSGQSGRPYPPPSNTNAKGGRLAAGGADQRLRMNKRMTRLGNMNL